MRFIYLSKSDDSRFITREGAINYFENLKDEDYRFYLINKGSRRSHIDSRLFNIDEDVFFIWVTDNIKKRGEVIAYCKSNSKIKDDLRREQEYFEVNRNTIKIFMSGIDLEMLNSFVYINNSTLKREGKTVRQDYFTSQIGKGSCSWRYFQDKENIKMIMSYIKNIVFENSYKFF